MAHGGECIWQEHGVLQMGIWTDENIYRGMHTQYASSVSQSDTRAKDKDYAQDKGHAKDEGYMHQSTG